MDEDKDQLYNVLINDSIRFLESLGNYYGAERAMEVWSALGPTVGDDVKGQVFMNMLSGNNHSMRLELSRSATPYSGHTHSIAVPVIKTLRTATGLGLKEAKDMCDSLFVGNTIRIEVEPNTRNGSLLLLRMAGFVV